jgi:hypothetical protein
MLLPSSVERILPQLLPREFSQTRGGNMKFANIKGITKLSAERKRSENSQNRKEILECKIKANYISPSFRLKNILCDF